MSVALEQRLREAGLPCRVESRDRLAILVPEGSFAMTRDHRLRALQMARAEGFTHVSLELDPDGAALPGN